MVFEETIKELNLRIIKPTKYSKIRIDLEPEREYKLQQINKVYSQKILNKRIGRTKLIKMAIDNLIADVEKQASEEEGLEYLRTLYKEAEF